MRRPETSSYQTFINVVITNNATGLPLEYFLLVVDSYPLHSENRNGTLTLRKYDFKIQNIIFTSRRVNGFFKRLYLKQRHMEYSERFELRLFIDTRLCIDRIVPELL